MRRAFPKAVIRRMVVAYFSLLSAQQQRCFQFIMRYQEAHHDWRDSAFVACASDPVLIEQVLAELIKPLEERYHINGRIAHGDGGHNFNGTYRFRWHFVPDEWGLAEVSVEVCDGRPYSDVETNLTYWVEQLGRFCPWASAPVREVSIPGRLTSVPFYFSFVPNPAREWIRVVSGSLPAPLHLKIYTSMGLTVRDVSFLQSSGVLDVSDLAEGVYILQVEAGNVTIRRLLFIVG